jgi:hypothetical protein
MGVIPLKKKFYGVQIYISLYVVVGRHNIRSCRKQNIRHAMAGAEGKPVLMSKHRAVLAYKGSEGTAPQIMY